MRDAEAAWGKWKAGGSSAIPDLGQKANLTTERSGDMVQPLAAWDGRVDLQAHHRNDELQASWALLVADECCAVVVPRGEGTLQRMAWGRAAEGGRGGR